MGADNIVNIICAFIGAIIGGTITFFTEWKFRKNDNKVRKNHASSLLYYDLKSIQTYLSEERGSVNIRYSSEWQDILAQCYFLKSEEVEYIYKIYDKVYNYNFHYEKKSESGMSFKKEDIAEYKILKEHIFDCSKKFINEDAYNMQYSKIMNKLKVKK